MHPESQFIDDIFTGLHGRGLLPYQIRLLNELRLHKRVIILKSRQIGVSYLLAAYALTKAIDGKVVLIISASERQSKNVLHYANKFLQRIRHAIPELTTKEESKTAIMFSHGGALYSFPNSAPTIAGFTADLVIMDEYAKFMHDSDRECLAAVSPALATTNGQLIFVSTPYGERGLLFEFWRNAENRDLYRMKFHWTDSPIITPEFIEGERRMLDDLTFKQEYEHLFIGEQFTYFPFELLNACIVDGLQRIQGTEVFIGVDIGRRSDFTAITIVQKERSNFSVLHFEKLRDVPFAQQQARITELIKQFEPSRVCIDEGGIGMMLAENLKDEFHGVVKPVSFNNDNKNEMMTTLKRLFESKEIAIPDSQALIGALHMIQRTQAGGLVKYESDSTDEFGHADVAWSLALSVSAASEHSRYSVPDIGLEL